MHPAQRLRDEMERLFETFTGEPGAWSPLWSGSPRTFPALNVWEDAECFYAEAEVPGLSMKDIELFVTGDELTLRGTSQKERREGVTFHRRERGTDSFSRVIRLPADINGERVAASLKDGVLTIKLPKAEAAKPRKIEVRCTKE
jgi:HSP20 family protein